MATSVTVESVLQKISEGHLECQICTDRFQEPKVLECSHSFCLECLQKLAERVDPPTQKLICPVCRHETILSGKGVAGLRTDFKLNSLVEEINQLESEQQKQRPGQVHISKCSKHTDKGLIMYCETCQRLICTTCIRLDHRMHPVIELTEALHKCRQQANEELAKVRQSINTFNIAVQDIDMTRKTLDVMFASTKDRISKKADEEIAKTVTRIKGEEQKLVQEAEHIYKDRVKTFENAQATNIKVMTKAQRKQYEVNQMIHEGCSEILHLKEKLLQDLKEYTYMQPNTVPDAMAFMDFEESQQNLGKLVLEPAEEKLVWKPLTQHKRKTWTLKEEMMKYMKGVKQMEKFSPCDVAAYSNSDIVVVDFQNRSLMTATGNPQSILKVQLIKGLSRPRRVAVNKNDELIVLDSNCSVKIFNRKYQLLSQFKPGGWSSNTLSSCIAVDNNNLVAVGDYHNDDVVSLHNADGSIVRTIQAVGIGTNLTFSKQHLIYTTLDDKKLVSVNHNGEVVFSVDINHSGLPYGLPYGLCCEEDGSIYVAVAEGSSGEIQHYSPDGNYLGCIIKGCNNPHSITLTPAGHLVVAVNKSVQIYHHE